MKKIIYLFFEKNGMLKIGVSMLLVTLFMILYKIFDMDIILWIAGIPGVYLFLYFIILMVYAWIINPLNKRKENKDA